MAFVMTASSTIGVDTDLDIWGIYDEYDNLQGVSLSDKKAKHWIKCSKYMNNIKEHWKTMVGDGETELGWTDFAEHFFAEIVYECNDVVYIQKIDLLN